MKKIYRTILCVSGLLILAGCGPKQEIRTPQVAAIDAQIAESQIEPFDNSFEADIGDVKSAVKPLPVAIDPADRPVMTKYATEKTFAPSIEHINNRIYAYGEKLKSWEILDQRQKADEEAKEDLDVMLKCFQDIINISDGYNKFRDEILQRQNFDSTIEKGVDRFVALQKSDIEFMEGSCAKTLGGRAEDKTTHLYEQEDAGDLPQVETKIENYSKANDYENVIKVWEQIPESSIERVNLITKLAYANALIYQHDQKKAANVYQQIVTEMPSSEEKSTDIISLRKELADLYVAAKEYKKAQEQYNQISYDFKTLEALTRDAATQVEMLAQYNKNSPELIEFSDLLGKYLGYIPEEDGYTVAWKAEEYLKKYPGAFTANNVDKIHDDSFRRANEWFDSFIANVDQLRVKKEFENALELLMKVSSDIIPTNRRQELDSKEQEILTDEEVERKKVEMADMQRLDRKWNSGQMLAKNGDYENAIAVFIELLGTVYEGRASERIEELTLSAAKEERRKAALKYKRFQKATDQQVKEKLIVECWQQLNKVLARYPDVSIASKVQANIAGVEAAMEIVKPGLLAELQMAAADSMQIEPEPEEEFLPMEEETSFEVEEDESEELLPLE